jgi:hypothetical protein
LHFKFFGKLTLFRFYRVTTTKISRTVEALEKTITYLSLMAQSTIPHAPVSLLAALHRTRARTTAPAPATAPARQGSHTDEGWPRLPNARPPTSCRESGSAVLPKAATKLKKKQAEYRGHSAHEAGGWPLSRRPSPSPIYDSTAPVHSILTPFCFSPFRLLTWLFFSCSSPNLCIMYVHTFRLHLLPRPISVSPLLSLPK